MTPETPQSPSPPDHILTRLMALIAVSIGAVLIGGILGLFVGREVGRRSPSFVRLVLTTQRPESLPPNFDPVEYATGLGMINGMLLGLGTSLFLATLLVVREVWLESVRRRTHLPPLLSPAQR